MLGSSGNLWALGNRKTDTRGEVALRFALHRRGVRFRKNMSIHLADRIVRPDVVLPRARIAVFVHGCFWHSCSEHDRRPMGSRSYWDAKLDDNVARGRLVDAQLSAGGWLVGRIWEHIPVAVAATVVPNAVAVARSAAERNVVSPMVQTAI